MYIQYGTVTSVFPDTHRCNVKGHLTNAEYQNCEIPMVKGVSSLPKAGDLVAFAEIHNSEIVVLGVVEQINLSLQEGEILLHNGQGFGSSYVVKATVKLDVNNNIVLTAGSSVLTIGQNGAITINGSQVGFFGSSAAQQSAIADADGTLGSVNSKLNSLLAAMRAYGLLDS